MGRDYRDCRNYRDCREGLEQVVTNVTVVTPSRLHFPRMNMRSSSPIVTWNQVGRPWLH